VADHQFHQFLGQLQCVRMVGGYLASVADWLLCVSHEVQFQYADPVSPVQPEQVGRRLSRWRVINPGGDAGRTCGSVGAQTHAFCTSPTVAAAYQPTPTLLQVPNRSH